MFTRKSLPQNYIKTPYTLLDDMSNVSGWAAQANAAVSKDTSYVLTGDSSIKITTSAATAGTYCAVDKNVVNFSMIGVNRTLMIKVYVPDPSKITSLIIYLGNSSSIGSVNWNLSFSGPDLVPGWNYLSAYPTEGLYTGGFSWSSQIQKMRITIVQATTSPASVIVDSIHYGGQSKPKILITFDDAWKTVYDNAYPIMQKYGIKSTVYTIPSFLSDSGQPQSGTGYVNKAALTDMASKGHCIANHTWDHTYYLTNASTVDHYADVVQRARDWLNGNGFSRGADHLAYPKGEYDQAVVNRLKQMGMKTARSTYSGSKSNPPFVSDFFKMTERGFSSTVTLTLAKKWVDYAIESGGYTFFMFHQIPVDDTVTTGGNQPSLAWSSSKFDSLMQYIKMRGVDCPAVDEWYEGMTNPRYRPVY